MGIANALSGAARGRNVALSQRRVPAFNVADPAIDLQADRIARIESLSRSWSYHNGCRKRCKNWKPHRGLLPKRAGSSGLPARQNFFLAPRAYGWASFVGR